MLRGVRKTERNDRPSPLDIFTASLFSKVDLQRCGLICDHPEQASPIDDAWLRGAEKIAAYIDCPRSRIYALVSVHLIPVHHDGSALIARRSELDRWLRRGGGRRP